MGEKGIKRLDKIPKRMEIKTMMRILMTLDNNGPQKRTNTSTYCNMSYSRFIPYMNFMIVISVLMLDPSQILHITQLGKKLLEYLKIHHID